MMRAQSYVACRAWLFSERLQFLMSPLATRCSSAAPTAIMALVTTTQPRPKSEGNLVSTARMISPHQRRHSFICPGPGRDGVVSFFFFFFRFHFLWVLFSRSRTRRYVQWVPGKDWHYGTTKGFHVAVSPWLDHSPTLPLSTLCCTQSTRDSPVFTHTTLTSHVGSCSGRGRGSHLISSCRHALVLELLEACTQTVQCTKMYI